MQQLPICLALPLSAPSWTLTRRQPHSSSLLQLKKQVWACTATCMRPGPALPVLVSQISGTSILQDLQGSKFSLLDCADGQPLGLVACLMVLGTAPERGQAEMSTA